MHWNCAGNRILKRVSWWFYFGTAISGVYAHGSASLG
jgi:hypothetical protein